MALVRITRAIFGNESSVLTVSAMLRGGRYGQSEAADICQNSVDYLLGSAVALVTPMKDDFSVNYEELDRLLDFPSGESDGRRRRGGHNGGIRHPDR